MVGAFFVGGDVGRTSGRAKGRNTAQIVTDAYRQHGAMTVSQCHGVTGIHTERIRRIVRWPLFEMVRREETKGAPMVWRLVETE